MTVETWQSDKEATNGFNDDADMRRLGKVQEFKVRAEDLQTARYVSSRLHRGTSNSSRLQLSP